MKQQLKSDIEFTVLHVHPAVQKAEFPTYTIFIL